MLSRIASIPKAVWQETQEVTSIFTGEASEELKAMPTSYKVFKVARLALGMMAISGIIGLIVFFAAPEVVGGMALFGIIQSLAMGIFGVPFASYKLHKMEAEHQAQSINKGRRRDAKGDDMEKKKERAHAARQRQAERHAALHQRNNDSDDEFGNDDAQGSDNGIGVSSSHHNNNSSDDDYAGSSSRRPLRSRRTDTDNYSRRQDRIRRNHASRYQEQSHQDEWPQYTSFQRQPQNMQQRPRYPQQQQRVVGHNPSTSPHSQQRSQYQDQYHQQPTYRPPYSTSRQPNGNFGPNFYAGQPSHSGQNQHYQGRSILDDDDYSDGRLPV